VTNASLEREWSTLKLGCGLTTTGATPISANTVE